MLLDNALLVSDEQDVTVTAVSTNSVDLKTARDLGVGESIYAFFVCTAIGTVATGTTGFQIVTASDAALTTGLIIVATTPQIVDDDITVDMRPVFLPFNPDPSSLIGNAQRYLGVRYNVAAAMTGTWAYTAGFLHGIDASARIYPSGFEVL
jgi:hypothetical protein